MSNARKSIRSLMSLKPPYTNLRVHAQRITRGPAARTELRTGGPVNAGPQPHFGSRPTDDRCDVAGGIPQPPARSTPGSGAEHCAPRAPRRRGPPRGSSYGSAGSQCNALDAVPALGVGQDGEGLITLPFPCRQTEGKHCQPPAVTEDAVRRSQFTRAPPAGARGPASIARMCDARASWDGARAPGAAAPDQRRRRTNPVPTAAAKAAGLGFRKPEPSPGCTAVEPLPLPLCVGRACDSTNLSLPPTAHRQRHL